MFVFIWKQNVVIVLEIDKECEKAVSWFSLHVKNK